VVSQHAAHQVQPGESGERVDAAIDAGGDGGAVVTIEQRGDEVPRLGAGHHLRPDR
jgi:hypothetical protein